MKKYFPLSVIVICIIAIFVIIELTDEPKKEKTDYSITLTKDYKIIIRDLKGHVIYSDTTNFYNPNKIEKALIDDNL